MLWTASLDGGPCRVNHGAVAIGDTIYSIGGYTQNGNFREFSNIDVHLLDTIALRWRPCKYNISESDAVPFQRYGHTVVTFDNKVYLWGGRNDRRACNVLYCFDPVSNTWSTPPVKGKSPPARDGHSACVIGKYMYIFGGFIESTDRYTQELYALNLESFTWDYINTKGEKPLYRDFHTASVVDGIMYVWGGRELQSGHYTSPSQEEYGANMYIFDPRTKYWNCITTYGKIPNGRRSHSSVVFGEFIYYFGGYNSKEEKHYDDLYRFNTESHTWELLKPLGKGPIPRRRQATCLVGKTIYLFGGTSPRDDSQPLIPPHEELDYYYQDRNLVDHGDLYVLELEIKLKSLCLMKVIEYKLSTSDLPRDLRFQIKALTTPNTISQSG